MSYPHTNCAKRTDQSFRNREQMEHHKERSLIEDIIGFDMVADVVTSDPLHLLHLGVIKRCLLRWVEGTKSYANKIKTRELNKINLLLSNLKSQMPTEIHRAVRDFSVLHFWKGTEFRTFLLYLGITVLKDMVPTDEYNHFMHLYCAVVLCSSDVYERVVHNTDLVDTLLSDYIERYIEIYGEQTISSNVHNLCHLKDDMIRFGNLNSISTYPFENALYIMKTKLRAMRRPLEQLSRRMTEIFLVVEENVESSHHTTELKHPLRCDKSKYQAIFLKDFRLSSQKFGDKFFMDKTNRIIQFKYATRENGLILLHGYEVKDKRDFFTYPLSSSKLNIYCSNNEQIFLEEECHEMIVSKVKDIKCKMVCTSCSDSEFLFQPLIHTL